MLCSFSSWKSAGCGVYLKRVLKLEMERKLSTGMRVERRLMVSVSQATEWFLSLRTHPERYQFGSHGGFIFTRGDFAEVGAQFQTHEWFIGIPLTLNFELTGVNELSFEFKLLRPSLPVWGKFVIEPEGPRTALLTLVIGGETRIGQCLIGLPGVKQAIRQQTQREVDHIGESVESEFSS